MLNENTTWIYSIKSNEKCLCGSVASVVCECVCMRASSLFLFFWDVSEFKSYSQKNDNNELCGRKSDRNCVAEQLKTVVCTVAATRIRIEVIFICAAHAAKSMNYSLLISLLFECATQHYTKSNRSAGKQTTQMLMFCIRNVCMFASSVRKNCVSVQMTLYAYDNVCRWLKISLNCKNITNAVVVGVFGLIFELIESQWL